MSEGIKQQISDRPAAGGVIDVGLDKNNIKDLLPWEKSLELAKKLLEKYKDEIRKNFMKDVDGYDPNDEYLNSDFQRSIEHYLIRNVPDETKKHYFGHGITRGRDEENLAAFICIAANNLIKGEYGVLAGQGYGSPFTRADLFILSKKDTRMDVQGKNPKNGRIETVIVKAGDNYLGWKADIGAMIVDVKFYPLVDELKTLFPEANIIMANEIPRYLESQEQSGNN
jgi:hypothetical protein